MDGGLSTLYHICRFVCQQSVLKTFSDPGQTLSEDGVFWLWDLPENFFIWFNISFCYCWVHLVLRLILRDGGLSTLCHTCEFACQQRVLKTFSCSGCFCCEDWVVWLWHLLISFYIWLTISSCYCSTLFALRLTRRDSGLSSLCHSCELGCQYRVLETLSVPGFLRSKHGVFWLWHLLENFYAWSTISYCYYKILLALGLIGVNGDLSTACHSGRFACQQRVPEIFPGTDSRSAPMMG